MCLTMNINYEKYLVKGTIYKTIYERNSVSKSI